jgi:hypothetical protein
MAIEGYDLVMLGILAAAAVLGYFKGMVWQIAWIAGIAASGFLALRFSGQLAPMFGQQAPWNRLIAMLAIYVGTSLAVWLVFRVISGAINAIHLSAFDHQLGLLLGIANGVRHTHPGLAPLESPQFADFGLSQTGKVKEAAKVFDQLLQTQAWMAGPRFTIADITAFCALEFGRALLKFTPADLGLQALQEWRDRMAARPSAKVV